MKLVLVSSLIALAMIGFAEAYVARAQQPKPTSPWAEVQLGPGLTAVIVRDGAPAGDQLIVRTFYWDQVKGLDKPILRSVSEVVPMVRDTAVAANGAPDPSKVETVHIDIVKILDRMSWSPPAAKP